MNKRKLIFLITAFVLFFPLVSLRGALSSPAEKLCFSTMWPHETSDLQPDPRLIFGRLANGFRYVIMKNTEPRDRVGMYLDVQTGSLNEKDNERGVAHFLEHMVFNGSTHFQPGQLIEYFQSLGMSFGGDTNAHTSYNETVYNIILPNGAPQEIEKGLLVFSDYARGALLLDEQIDRERGVIFSEKRSRDSAAYRTNVATGAFTLRGTRMPARLPIGDPETLRKADHALLQEYYDTWYRPENMVLVMVGDLDPAAAEPLIKKRFAALAATGAQPDCTDFGRLDHQGLESFYHYEPEMGATKVELETVWEERQKNDSFALQVAELKNMLATAMIVHRLEKLGEDPGTPFTKSGYASGEILGRVGYGAISASTDPEKWQEALKVLEKTLRQAVQYGFSEEEFQRAKKEFLAGLDTAVLTGATRNSMSLASAIIAALNRNRVPQSPVQEKEVFGPVAAQMTLAEVQESLVSVWSHPNRLVEISGNVKIDGEHPEAGIQKIYQDSRNEDIEPQRAEQGVDFPYLQSAEAEIKPVARILLPGQEAERLVLPNGVVLNLKRTDFKKNTIELRADFGHGKQAEPLPGLAMLAQAVVNGSGSGRLTASDLARVLAGSSVSLSFKVNESSSSWGGTALAKDMELLFQITQTVLDDPGIRMDAYRIAMENFAKMYKNLDRDINGAQSLHVQSFLAGGYPHAGFPPWEDFARLTLAQVQEWLRPEITGAPLEISIVGDFDRDRLVAVAGRYLGSLAKRPAQAGVDDVKISFPAGKQLQVKVDSSVDKAMVVVAWPTADFWDIGRTRRLNVLAAVFSDRLRKIVREELGATYSPVVFNSSSRIFPGYGLLQAQVTVEPGHTGQVRDVLLKIGDDLQRDGCTDDELERAKAPIMTSLKDMVRSNAYWLNTVLSLSARHPQQLEWPMTLLNDFRSVTGKEITALAAQYLVRDRAAVAVIEPGKTGGKVPASQSPDNP